MQTRYYYYIIAAYKLRPFRVLQETKAELLIIKLDYVYNSSRIMYA